MSEHLNDQLYQEEIERFVGWWRRHGGRLLVGFLLALALVGGWRWYRAQRASARVKAARDYAALSATLSQGSLARADVLARMLLRRHPTSPYALFASLALARAELSAGHAPQALFFARWARRHPGLEAFRPLVFFRVAEIDLALHHPHRARAVLKGSDPGRYAFLYALARAQADRALHRPRREFDALGLVHTLAPPGSGWRRWAQRARGLLLPTLTPSLQTGKPRAASAAGTPSQAGGPAGALRP